MNKQRARFIAIALILVAAGAGLAGQLRALAASRSCAGGAVPTKFLEVNRAQTKDEVIITTKWSWRDPFGFQCAYTWPDGFTTTLPVGAEA